MKRILSFLTVAALLTGAGFAQAEGENAAPVATEEAPKDSAAIVKNESETSKKFKARASVEGEAWFAATIDGNTTNEGTDNENKYKVKNSSGQEPVDKYYENNGFNRASLNAKSRLKINMDLLPKFTSYIEVLILNNEKKRGNLFDRHGRDDALGFRDLFLYGILAKPIDHWGQGDYGEFIMLDQAKIGIDTEWFDWETGWRNAKMPEHKVGYWDTVKGIKASDAFHGGYGGYGWFGMQKDAKKGLKEVGPVGLNVAASFSHESNNISALNGNGFKNSHEGFGNIIDMFTFVDLGLVEDMGAEKAEEKYLHHVGLQFDSAISYDYRGSRKTYMPSADVILGYDGKFPMGIYGGVNVLFNVHDTEPTKDLSALHDLALATKLGWKWEFVDKLEFGVKMRGNNTNLIFVEKVGEVLGDQNSLKFELKDNFKVYEGIKLGVDGDVAFTLDKDAVKKNAKAGAGKDKDNVAYGIKPHLDIDLNDLANMNGALSFYTQLKGVSEDGDKFVRGSDKSKFICSDVGLKFSSGSDKKPLNDTVNFYNVYLNWHNASELSDKAKTGLNGMEHPFSFFTLSGDIRLKSKMTLNGGIGARIPNKDVKGDSSFASPVGVFLGFDYKFDDKTIGGPTLFVRTQVGMKGYKELGDGIKVDRNKDSYVIKGGKYLTNWDLSTGIKWTF